MDGDTRMDANRSVTTATGSLRPRTRALSRTVAENQVAAGATLDEMEDLARKAPNSSPADVLVLVATAVTLLVWVTRGTIWIYMRAFVPRDLERSAGRLGTAHLGLGAIALEAASRAWSGTAKVAHLVSAGWASPVAASTLLLIAAVITIQFGRGGCGFHIVLGHMSQNRLFSFPVTAMATLFVVEAAAASSEDSSSAAPVWFFAAVVCAMNALFAPATSGPGPVDCRTRTVSALPIRRPALGSLVIIVALAISTLYFVTSNLSWLGEAAFFASSCTFVFQVTRIFMAYFCCAAGGKHGETAPAPRSSSNKVELSSLEVATTCHVSMLLIGTLVWFSQTSSWFPPDVWLPPDDSFVVAEILGIAKLASALSVCFVSLIIGTVATVKFSGNDRATDDPNFLTQQPGWSPRLIPPPLYSKRSVITHITLSSATMACFAAWLFFGRMALIPQYPLNDDLAQNQPRTTQYISPVSWLASFILMSDHWPPQFDRLATWRSPRLVALGIWITIVPLFLFAVHRYAEGSTSVMSLPRSRQSRLRLTLVRKLFHFACVALAVPMLLVDPQRHSCFVAAVLYALLLILLLIEIARVSGLPSQSFGIAINKLADRYIDARDLRGVILTHIYLAAGLLFPLMFELAVSTVARRPLDILLALQGFFTVGLGDAVAAPVGLQAIWRTHQLPRLFCFSSISKSWEGTLAFAVTHFISQIFVAALVSAKTTSACLLERITSCVLDPHLAVPSIITAVLSATFEAYVDEIDNLILPIFGLVTFRTFQVATLQLLHN